LDYYNNVPTVGGNPSEPGNSKNLEKNPEFSEFLEDLLKEPSVAGHIQATRLVYLLRVVNGLKKSVDFNR
jgi:hypothetical protein